MRYYYINHHITPTLFYDMTCDQGGRTGLMNALYEKSVIWMEGGLPRPGLSGKWQPGAGQKPAGGWGSRWVGGWDGGNPGGGTGVGRGEPNDGRRGLVARPV